MSDILNALESSHIITIFSQRFEVRISDPKGWSSIGLGRCSLRDGLILLHPDLTEDLKMHTLLHEILHWVADMHQLDVAKEETEIDVLASALLDFMRRNPEVVKRICQTSVSG